MPADRKWRLDFSITSPAIASKCFPLEAHLRTHLTLP
jgi:hypothetical protein